MKNFKLVMLFQIFLNANSMESLKFLKLKFKLYFSFILKKRIVLKANISSSRTPRIVRRKSLQKGNQYDIKACPT
jgi:hypothetical protein